MPSTSGEDRAQAGEPPTRPAANSSRSWLVAPVAVLAAAVLVGVGVLIWHPWQSQRGSATVAAATTAGAPPVQSTSGATPTPSASPGAIVPVAAPNPALATDPVVGATQASVVKIRGTAASCQKVLEGSGFVVAPDTVMSNAHVVAGAETFGVESGGITYDAHVVSYDPDADVSILSVPGLPSTPLAFDLQVAASGTDALMMGYPNGGDFTAAPARVREVIRLNGPNIYRTKTVLREVYTIRGTVRSGETGGPLMGLDGKVLGMVFGSARVDPDTGFAMTANELARQMAKVGDMAPVSTGECMS